MCSLVPDLSESVRRFGAERGIPVFRSFFGNNIDFGNGTKNAVGVDAYLVKFSPSGSYLWDKTFGTTLDQFGTSVAVDSAGEVLIAGYFFNSITLGMTTHTSLGGSDIYVAKFTSDGTYLWSQRFGGASDDQAKALALGQNNEIMFIGTTKGSIDFGNGIQTANMGVADVLVAKLNAGGMPIWAKTFGSAGNSQIGNGIDVDGSGHVVITGGFTGTIDFGGGILTSGGGNDIFVAKLDNAGAQIWSKRFGDANANQVGNGVVVTASGARSFRAGFGAQEDESAKRYVDFGSDFRSRDAGFGLVFIGHGADHPRDGCDAGRAAVLGAERADGAHAWQRKHGERARFSYFAGFSIAA